MQNHPILQRAAVEWCRTEFFEIPPRSYVSWPQYHLAEQVVHSGRIFSRAASIPATAQQVFPSPAFGNDRGLIPRSLVTVLPVPDAEHQPYQWIMDFLKKVKEKDDVFSDKFLSGIVFLVGSDLPADKEAQIYQAALELGTSWAKIVDQSSVKGLKAGPYVLAEDVLWEVRLSYEDTYGAFIVTTRENLSRSEGSHMNLQVAGKVYQTLSAAVPSRMSSLLEPGPFSGLRIAVKDMFRVKGLKTSAGNKAYFDISTPASSTSHVISRLLDGNAQLLGMTKLSQLAGREEPMEAIDYQSPFNPRGDGYQSPAGSSSGSAVAIAAYDWIDITIGTDTTGSGRRPALVNGCFALRPSWKSEYLDGMIQTFSEFDTPCAFARSIQKLKNFTQAWLFPALPMDHTVPLISNLIMLQPKEYWPVGNAEQMRLVRGFGKDLAENLSAELEQFSIEEEWSKTKPTEAGDCKAVEYLDEVATYTFLYGFYHNFEKFRQIYFEKYNRPPFVNPIIRYRWDNAKKIDEEQHKVALHRLEVYRKWFLENVMNFGGRRVMILLPIANVEPNYRDQQPPPPSKQHAFDPLYLAPILGTPELVVPIGQLSYQSRISEQEAQLPVAISVMSEPGSDLELLHAVQHCLEAAGRPTEVDLGPNIFPITAAASMAQYGYR